MKRSISGRRKYPNGGTVKKMKSRNIKKCPALIPA